MDDKLKKYLFEWLLDNTNDDVLIGISLANTDIKFPFTPQNINAQNPIIVLRLKYAKGLSVDDSGISAFISFNPTGNIPNEELCFFPWNSLFLIASEGDCYVFSFKVNADKVESNDTKPKLRLI